MFNKKRIVIVLCLAILGATGAFAALKPEQVDMAVDATLVDFDKIVTNSEELMGAAKGALICPKITKVGLGVGLESGVCALEIDGKPVSYWKASSASFGLTAGIQSQSQIMAFMTSEALQKFQDSSRGFEIGVTGNVAVMNKSASGKVNTSDIKAPIAMWVFSGKGLMADLSVDGSQYKRIAVVGEDVYLEAPVHRFVATAELSGRSNDPTAQMTIDIDSWVTAEEREHLRTILENQSAEDFHAALAAMPDMGTVKQPGGEMVIQYAYWTKMPNDMYRVILGSTEPMTFLNPKAQASRIDENVTVIQLDLEENRVGTGVVQMGAEIGWDDGVTIHSDQRTPPVKLSSVSYKKLQ
jgi:lipid-binding SYLF domain-containing protein